MERIRSNRRKARMYVIGACFALSFGVLIVKAVSFQLVDTKKLEKVAFRQYRTAVREATRRGEILDARGRQLAVSVATSSLYADPKRIKDVNFISKKLAYILKDSVKKFKKKLSLPRRFVWLKRWAEQKNSEAVLKLNVEGIYSLTEHKRSYPHSTLASVILGAVGLDGQPLGGLEYHYNEYLSASKLSDGEYKRDAKGRIYFNPDVESLGETPSKITLTVDKTIQFITENALKNAVEKSKAKSGTAIVLEPNTGQVLAMAVYPDFDPNNFRKFPLARWRNRTITDAFEPGSTFKAVIMAQVLENGLAKNDDIINCENGAWEVAGGVVSDSHPMDKLTFQEVIKYSSNIGASKIGLKLGREGLFEAAKKFGYGEKSGIDLPAESKGILANPSKWSDLQEVTFSFGQGISATPLQIANSFAVFANGGVLMEPYIVQKIESNDGDIKHIPRIKRRVISRATADIMKEDLRLVVEGDGTGGNASSLEYEVAGKTGTAQKAKINMRGYDDGKYFSSFVGFAPVSNPKIVVFVGIDEPEGKYYGGEVAAPGFKRIVEDTLHYLKVPAEKLMVADEDESDEDGPTLLAGNNTELTRKPIRAGKNRWILPDWRGKTMRSVLESIGNIPIDVKFKGSGKVIKQIPNPGSIVKKGGKCNLVFKKEY